jgi:hypothetical protein
VFGEGSLREGCEQDGISSAHCPFRPPRRASRIARISSVK